MIDLHTHILPGMDDGAPDIETSFNMLRLQKQHGVDAVALTPHFYRTKERTERFLERRTAAVNALKQAMQGEDFPRLIVGAEVFWVPGMAEWPELEDLCYENTKFLLVEPPFEPWNEELFRQLYSLIGRRGITPVIAHLDRYFGWQSRQKIRQLLDLGFPIQVSGFSLRSPLLRRRVMDLLRYHEALLISDCHNMSDRPPNIGESLKIIKQKYGEEAAAQFSAVTDEILLD